MPTLQITNFNIVLTVLGGWISLFGLVSFLCKETFYLSEALISLLVGVAFSPYGANFIRPLEYAGTLENVNTVTLYFSRLVLGVQLVLAGVQLPSRYLQTQWKPLALLVGPIMTCMWLATSLLVFALVPGIPFLHALAIGACVTPTDPILSNVIVKGRFADHNIPKDLQELIIAESGANDGLGYPFLFFALYLIKYVGDGHGNSAPGGVGAAFGLWFGETWGYTIILSVIYGAVSGWLARSLLSWAERHKYVDRESFLVFAISLALFITGSCGMIGSDDVLACFIAGNVFTWDDWFRLETMDDSLQPTIDMLLNVSVFLWFGAVCPWPEFASNAVVPIWRLVLLGILVLLFRRLPFVWAIHRFIPQISRHQQAVFVGFFGPIGVSAIFYLYVTLEFLHTFDVGEDEPREDVANLGETVHVVVWFLAVCSIVVHGLSIPVGKLGYFVPLTLSRSFGRLDDDAPFRLRSARATWPFGGGSSRSLRTGLRSGDVENPSAATSRDTSQRPTHGRAIFNIGGSVIPAPAAVEDPAAKPAPENAPLPVPSDQRATMGEEVGKGKEPAAQPDPDQPPRVASQRTIRFNHEPPHSDSTPQET